MASLYQNLLEDPRIEFATSSDQGQRLAALQRTFQQAGLGGADHVADRGRVPEARDADHDVGRAEPRDLGADCESERA